MKYLVVNADDFGIAPEVNEAVEIAHRKGVLSAASLMVSAPAAAEAVALARALPRLAVGLHLVLTDGKPTSSPDEVPDLVDRTGRLECNMLRLSLRIARVPEARVQMEAEIDAQFAAFAATGLACDHVNAHRHLHLHPQIGAMVLRAASRAGVRGMRAPVEPGFPSGSGWLAAPFARHLRSSARLGGFKVPDRVFGLRETGRMTVDRLANALSRVDRGLNEVYLHPAMRNVFRGSADGYDHRAELVALMAPSIRRALDESDICLGGFAGYSPSSA